MIGCGHRHIYIKQQESAPLQMIENGEGLDERDKSDLRGRGARSAMLAGRKERKEEKRENEKGELIGHVGGERPGQHSLPSKA